MHLQGLRESLFNFIKNDHPDLRRDGVISKEIFTQYRRRYLEQIVEQERGEIKKVETAVLAAIEKQELVSENIELTREEQLSLGERIADRVASFRGSWVFIISFGIILMTWIVLNNTLQ